MVKVNVLGVGNGRGGKRDEGKGGLIEGELGEDLFVGRGEGGR
jgi:hypothetical protein